mgnify:CR=1 FL=1
MTINRRITNAIRLPPFPITLCAVGKKSCPYMPSLPCHKCIALSHSLHLLNRERGTFAPEDSRSLWLYSCYKNTAKMI